ncbi:MAG: AAA domain-containing protein [Candidatus Thorarchaeota archaeon]|nr:AAA domain-containing protein [Candidatus Thorarchaeota archaeon]
MVGVKRIRRRDSDSAKPERNHSYEIDPSQLEASILAYRNLPEVDSDQACYHLMKRVSVGLADISRYLEHSIKSYEYSSLFILVQQLNTRVGDHILKNYPNARWCKIIKTVPKGKKKAQSVLRRGKTLLSPTEVPDVEPYMEKLPSSAPDEVINIVRNQGNDENGFLGYPVEVLDLRFNALLLSSAPNTRRRNEKFWVCYIPSAYSLRRYRDAVNNLIHSPTNNLRPLLNLFERRAYAQWPDFKLVRINDWLFLTDPDIGSENPFEDYEDDWDYLDDGYHDERSSTSEARNPSTSDQRRFVRLALSTPDFGLLWGPPGSGKTYTIMELIFQAVKRGWRVLFCASTHVAIDQALERLLANKDAMKYIVPLRIGDSEKISDSIREYKLARISSKYRQEIMDDLRKQPSLTVSQERWLSALGSKDGNYWMERTLLDSANLICGTTVGILQHPEIRRGDWFAHKPMFDLLIIDEASKTTFHEFLIPAHFAKRWILCGDPRQLSPFVDDNSIQMSIKSLIRDDWKRECCYDVFKAITYEKTQIVVISDDEEVKAGYLTQVEAKNDSAENQIISIINITEEPKNNDEWLKILGSQIIICSIDLAPILGRYLPGSVDIIRGNPKLLGSKFMARYEYMQQSGMSREIDDTWDTLLSRYMGFEFYTRNTKDGSFENYRAKKELLLPEFDGNSDEDLDDDDISKKTRQQFERKLDRIRICAYPSVLELLIEGFRPESEYDSTLNKGFPNDVKKRRLIKLKYQFRMHPEISAFPRKQIYDSSQLRDSPDISQRRKWSYPGYSSRAQWVEVNGIWSDDVNNEEISQLLSELSKFVRWTSDNPRDDGRKWEVAILSFYSNQVHAILERIINDSKLNQEGATAFSTKNVHVLVGTVDSIQGREADIVFISFVRNGTRGVGFIENPNRLNVALTRARYQLVLIGNRTYFSKQKRSALLRELSKLESDLTYGAD